jgi:hypothetical protein
MKYSGLYIAQNNLTQLQLKLMCFLIFELSHNIVM